MTGGKRRCGVERIKSVHAKAKLSAVCCLSQVLHATRTRAPFLANHCLCTTTRKEKFSLTTVEEAVERSELRRSEWAVAVRFIDASSECRRPGRCQLVNKYRIVATCHVSELWGFYEAFMTDNLFREWRVARFLENNFSSAPFCFLSNLLSRKLGTERRIKSEAHLSFVPFYFRDVACHIRSALKARLRAARLATKTCFDVVNIKTSSLSNNIRWLYFVISNLRRRYCKKRQTSLPNN